MNGLSFQERNAIHEEIHGVANLSVEETPWLLEQALSRFEPELQRINGPDRFAYDAIVNQPGNPFSKQLVQGKKLRLRFLRHSFFDIGLAASTMSAFFNLVHSLYGLHALKRFDTTLDFFINNEGIRILNRGDIQILPFRDRSGRRVVTLALANFSQIEEPKRIKIFLYIIYAVAIDEETQKNGVVLLLLPGENPDMVIPRPLHDQLSIALQTIPTRFASLHVCLLDGPFAESNMAIFRSIFGVNNPNQYLHRAKFHTGDQMKIEHELRGYGIPVCLIPTTFTGNLKTRNLTQWIKARRLLDAALKKDDCPKYVECPGRHDVIFRSTGSSCMLNPGNAALRGMFEDYHDEHVNAGQTEKRQLVLAIVKQIESKGGRFLFWDPRGWWIVLDDSKKVRAKVAKALRNFNRSRKSKS